jgi:hypothetical protein
MSEILGKTVLMPLLYGPVRIRRRACNCGNRNVPFALDLCQQLGHSMWLSAAVRIHQQKRTGLLTYSGRSHL